MGRDHRKLRVFRLADELTIQVYRATHGFPPTERFGIQSQIRRAAVSVAANLVEGCARESVRDYAHFATIAFASAAELHYLLSLSHRLGFLGTAQAQFLEIECDRLLKSLQCLLRALRSLKN